MKIEAKKHLDLANRHLEKVQAAWDDPTDWSDLAIYGFFCLENAAMAAAVHFGLKRKKAVSNRDKIQLANSLHRKHGLPSVGKLLTQLHRAEKYAVYGDITPPPLDPEDVAREIEEFVEAVSKILS